MDLDGAALETVVTPRGTTLREDAMVEEISATVATEDRLAGAVAGETAGSPAGTSGRHPTPGSRMLRDRDRGFREPLTPAAAVRAEAGLRRSQTPLVGSLGDPAAPGSGVHRRADR